MTHLIHHYFSPSNLECSYQREIYPPEQFERKRMYGLPLMVTADKELKNYLNSVLTQLNSEQSQLSQIIRLLSPLSLH